MVRIELNQRFKSVAKLHRSATRCVPHNALARIGSAGSALRRAARNLFIDLKWL
jgi:hypothetical protein